MSTQTKIVVGVIVALIVGVVVGYFLFRPTAVAITAGATPNARLAENYDPYIRTNGGLYTALPIQTLSTLTASTETVTGISSTATSSVTGNFCIYNGSNFTTISFSSNSTTPAYATSTLCQ
jgi:hypothetical protein